MPQEETGAATIRGLIQTPMPPEEKRAAICEALDREIESRALALGLSPEQIDAAFEELNAALKAPKPKGKHHD
jgi:hypothetical protein